MNTMYKKFIDKHGNFSHNLNIEIDESLSEYEKNTILYDIFNLINEKYIKKSNSPIGLYVYGSTGCGKTMIMDLFFDNAPVPEARKKRVHFHKFMLSIHQKLHEERSKGVQGDALPIIAKKFVRDEGYLLCLDEFQGILFLA